MTFKSYFFVVVPPASVIVNNSTDEVELAVIVCGMMIAEQEKSVPDLARLEVIVMLVAPPEGVVTEPSA